MLLLLTLFCLLDFYSSMKQRRKDEQRGIIDPVGSVFKVTVFLGSWQDHHSPGSSKSHDFPARKVPRQNMFEGWSLINQWHLESKGSHFLLLVGEMHIQLLKTTKAWRFWDWFCVWIWPDDFILLRTRFCCMLATSHSFPTERTKKAQEERDREKS